MARKQKEVEKTEKKSKGGRPRKDRTGMPSITPMEAVKFAKKAYENLGGRLTSFKGMADAMGMKYNYATKALGILASYYEIVSQNSDGWQLTDLGKRVARDDKEAIVTLVHKIALLGEIYDITKDKEVDNKYIEGIINKKRLYINAANLAAKYNEVIDYINTLKEGGHTKASGVENSGNEELLKITRLKYALDPPAEDEINALAKEVAEMLTVHQDHAIKVLGEQMLNNLDNTAHLKLLVNSVLNILSVRQKKS